MKNKLFQISSALAIVLFLVLTMPRAGCCAMNVLGIILIMSAYMLVEKKSKDPFILTCCLSSGFFLIANELFFAYKDAMQMINHWNRYDVSLKIEILSTVGFFICFVVGMVYTIYRLESKSNKAY